MTRERQVHAGLVVGFGLVVAGAGLAWDVGYALIVAGVLLLVWFLVFVDVDAGE